MAHRPTSIFAQPAPPVGTAAALVALALAAPILVAAPAHADAPVITCESVNNQAVRCPFNQSGGVRLVRQLSKSPCEYNRTWGYDTNGVWVNRGCRGQFALKGKAFKDPDKTSGGASGGAAGGSASGGNWGKLGKSTGDAFSSSGKNTGGNSSSATTSTSADPIVRTIKCQSFNKNYQFCPVTVTASVTMLRRLSKGGCLQGKDWGYRRDGVWVQAGCRAEFLVK